MKLRSAKFDNQRKLREKINLASHFATSKRLDYLRYSHCYRIIRNELLKSRTGGMIASYLLSPIHFMNPIIYLN